MNQPAPAPAPKADGMSQIVSAIETLLAFAKALEQSKDPRGAQISALLKQIAEIVGGKQAAPAPQQAPAPAQRPVAQGQNTRPMQPQMM